MKPRVITLEKTVLLGFSYYGEPFGDGWTEENQIGQLWKRFMAFWQEQGKDLPGLSPQYWYEVHTASPETRQLGYYDVFVGVAAESAEGLPPNALYKVLPAGEYALFTLVGDIITSDWGRPMNEVWLPAAGLAERWPICIERYDERFKGMDRVSESELDILVPVVRLDA